MLEHAIDGGPDSAAALLSDACDLGDAEGCAKLASSIENGARGGEYWNQRSRDLYARACDAGSSSGCGDLGLYFELGKAGTPIDYVMAERLYSAACDGGIPSGCLNLARRWIQYVDTPHQQAGIDLIQSECDRESPPFPKARAEACLRLSAYARTGFGIVKRDLVRSRSLAEKACHLGAPIACCSIADADVVSDDREVVEKTIKSMLRECKKGLACACERIGVSYATGRGLDISFGDASNYFKRSCEIDPRAGCTKYAEALFSGLGIGRNETEALRLVDQSCEKGDWLACSFAAKWRIDKKPRTPADWTAIDSRLALACSNNEPFGCELLGNLELEGRGRPADRERGANSLRKACELDPKYCLGFAKTKWLNSSTEEQLDAIRIADDACVDGAPDACHWLGVQFRAAKGVATDSSRALPYFQRACRLGLHAACFERESESIKEDAE